MADNSAREYRYQKDWSLGPIMYHVRCDDWEEFQEAVGNIEDMYTSKITTPAATVSTAPSSTPADGAQCKVCGSELLPEKRITAKTGASYWVRNCSNPIADFQHNKDGGMIRKAS